MADADLQDYQLRAVETHIQWMPDGSERDYFSGMLAARSGRFGDAVAQLNRALPHVRESAPKRAAMALEAIATAYRADNQYGDAARAYAELSALPISWMTFLLMTRRSLAFSVERHLKRSHGTAR